MENTRKIIVVKSNAAVTGGVRIYWLFSRTQLELVLKEIESTSVASDEGLCEATTHWQDDTLPVVYLEKYFGISESSDSIPTKHLFLKGARRESDEVEVSMIAIPVYADLQMGSLNIEGRSIHPGFLLKNQSDILGAYELTGKRIIVIPDIYRIAERSRNSLMQQEKT